MGKFMFGMPFDFPSDHLIFFREERNNHSIRALLGKVTTG